MVRLGVIATLVLMALGQAAMPATAQEEAYPPGNFSVTVSASAVEPGDSVVLTGRGWLPGSTITILLEPFVLVGAANDEILWTARVASDGSFSTSVGVPIDLAPGRYALVVSGTRADGNAAVDQVTLEVLGIGADVTLPDTGSDGSVGAVGTGREQRILGGGAGAMVLARTGGAVALATAAMVAAFVIGATVLISARRRGRRT